MPGSVSPRFAVYISVELEGVRNGGEFKSAGLIVPGMVALAGINWPDWGAAAARTANGCTACAASRAVPDPVVWDPAVWDCVAWDPAFWSAAASASERCELRRTAETPHKRHEAAVMVRTDERPKKSSGNDPTRC